MSRAMSSFIATRSCLRALSALSSRVSTPVFDAADALVQRFVFVRLAGEGRIFLTQFLQLLAFLREILDQWVMFDVHGTAPVCQEGVHLSLPAPRTG